MVVISLWKEGFRKLQTIIRSSFSIVVAAVSVFEGIDSCDRILHLWDSSSIIVRRMRVSALSVAVVLLGFAAQFSGVLCYQLSDIGVACFLTFCFYK